VWKKSRTEETTLKSSPEAFHCRPVMRVQVMFCEYRPQSSLCLHDRDLSRARWKQQRGNRRRPEHLLGELFRFQTPQTGQKRYSRGPSITMAYTYVYIISGCMYFVLSRLRYRPYRSTERRRTARGRIIPT